MKNGEEEKLLEFFRINHYKPPRILKKECFQPNKKQLQYSNKKTPNNKQIDFSSFKHTCFCKQKEKY